MNEYYTREFFREELSRFIEAMGSRAIMTSQGRQDGLIKGLTHVYIHATGLTDKDVQDFEVVVDMFARRAGRLEMDGRMEP